jgi:hypothetical protein
MQSHTWLLLAVISAANSAVSEAHEPVEGSEKLTLISFPGIKWVENNDPVMGGQSNGNWSVVDKSYGLFQGTVKNVSFLHAPGFCRAMTMAPFSKDTSKYLDGGLVITARTRTATYKGFKLSFGSLRTPRHHGGHEVQGSFKTKLILPASENNEWHSVFLKFADFSYDWSDYTGDCFTKDPDGYQHKCCTEETPDVCPTAMRLSGINSFNIWAEGAEGDFHLELKEIAAALRPDAALHKHPKKIYV